MAMHLARPININPTMYSWWPDKKRMASTNIRMGPMTQFCRSDNPSTLKFRKTCPSCSYLTLARGGYIMRIRPIAIGTFVVPTWK
jgi:hypothetical protein